MEEQIKNEVSTEVSFKRSRFISFLAVLQMVLMSIGFYRIVLSNNINPLAIGIFLFILAIDFGVLLIKNKKIYTIFTYIFIILFILLLIPSIYLVFFLFSPMNIG